MLEREGYLSRTIIPAVPVRVEYELTPVGHGLRELARTIHVWAETHIGEIEQARALHGAG